MSDQTFDFVAAKLAAMKAHVMDELNRELFASVMVKPVVPPTWPERVSWKLARVRGYFATLWDALLGRDPYDAEQ